MTVMSHRYAALRSAADVLKNLEDSAIMCHRITLPQVHLGNGSRIQWDYLERLTLVQVSSLPKLENCLSHMLTAGKKASGCPSISCLRGRAVTVFSRNAQITTPRSSLLKNGSLRRGTRGSRQTKWSPGDGNTCPTLSMPLISIMYVRLF